MEGYVKLWRKSLDSGVFQNADVWQFWCWCLMKASHKDRKMIVGFQEVDIFAGQFIFGRKKAALSLRSTEQRIRTCVDLLKSTSNITIKTTNKFSVITIVNWETYQQTELQNNQQINQQPNQQITNNQPTNNQQITTNKNEKKEKNEKNEKKTSIECPANIKKETWDAFVEMRKSMKAPLTSFSANLIVEKLAKLSSDNGNGMELILQQSIANNWKGVFPLKDGDYGRSSFGGPGTVTQKAGRASGDGKPYPVDHEF
jgi:transcriptional regulator with PAS, ATPase and Fis domain